MPVRLALIGSPATAHAYAPWLARLQDAVFTAVAAKERDDPEKVAEAANRLNAGISAGSLDELLERHADEFDAVILQGEASRRVEQAQKAARAGKHVLAHSPLATKLTDADAIIEACRAAGVCLMVDAHMRFSPSPRAIKEAAVSGKLGAPGLLRIHHWLPTSIMWTHAAQLDRVAARLVGLIDLAIWLLDDRPTSIYAVGDRQGSKNAPDYVQLHLGFPGGRMALIDDAHTLPADRKSASLPSAYFSLTLIGSTGAAYADDHHNTHLRYGSGSPTALISRHRGSCLILALQEFVNAIHEGREPAVTGAQARLAIEVAEAAVHSLYSKHAFQWDGGSYERA